MQGESTPKQGHFHQVFGRALTDKSYRDALTSGDRETQTAALREVIGEDPSDEMLKALNEAVGALRDFHRHFGDGEAVAAT